MASYLLLRSNKQTGPYTLDQLAQLGLKPYDLVWLEGRSAAWRYPSEIDELREFAPAVEEQPYDRFYKKPEEEKHFYEKASTPIQSQGLQQVSHVANTREEKVPVQAQEPNTPKYQEPAKEKIIQEVTGYAEIKTNQEPIQESHPPKEIYLQKDTEYSEKFTQHGNFENKASANSNEAKNNDQDDHAKNERRKIFVSMPFQKAMPVNTQLDKIPHEEKPPVITKQEPYHTKTPIQEENYEVKTTQQDSRPFREEHSQQEEFQPRPGRSLHNEKSNSYHSLKADPVDEKDKSALKEEFSMPLDEIKKMYMETYLQRKQKKGRKQKLLNISKYAAAAIFVVVLGSFVISNVLSGNNKNKIDATSFENKLPEQSEEKVFIPVNKTNKSRQRRSSEDVTERKSTTPKAKNKPVPVGNTEEEIVYEEPSENTEANGITKTSEAENRKKSSREIVKLADISSFVSVKSNAYKARVFGGIQNLKLTVRNESKYMIDKVLVELQYIKPNEQPLKSEIIYFNSIEPNSSLTMQIPDNPRGIKVNYKITHIVSNQYDQEIAGL